MSVDYDKLREDVRHAYANPPPEVAPEFAVPMAQFADVYADIVVKVTEALEDQQHPQLLGHAIVMTAIIGLLPMLARLSDDEDREEVRRFVIHDFTSSIRKDAEFIGDEEVPIPTKADA